MRVGVLTELQNGAAGRGGRQAAQPAAIPHSPRDSATCGRRGHPSLTQGFRGAAKGRLRYPFSLAAGPWQKVEERKSALRGRRPLALFRRPATGTFLTHQGIPRRGLRPLALSPPACGGLCKAKAKKRVQVNLTRFFLPLCGE